MVNPNLPLFQHPQEVWDAAKCAKVAKANPKNAFGDGYGKGYMGSSASIPSAYGSTHYNGGCERNGDWWQGEYRPFPQIAEGYEIIHISTRGWFLRKKGETKPDAYTSIVG